MTHPDPYIEEWKEFEKEFYKLTATMDGQYRPKLLLLFRNLYETQKSATKTQRIKDIEEIKTEAEKHYMTIREKDSLLEIDRKEANNYAVAGTVLFLTSRKAAIEEQ